MADPRERVRGILLILNVSSFPSVNTGTIRSWRSTLLFTTIPYPAAANQSQCEYVHNKPFPRVVARFREFYPSCKLSSEPRVAATN